MNGLLRNIEKILRNRRTRRKLQRTISLLAAIVVFVTTYSLVIPAITMEKNAGCGIEEHQHDDSCYEDQLICGLEESEEHQHTADCYERVIVCGKEAHTHSAACYPAETEVEVDAGTDDLAGNTDDAGDGVDTFVETTEGGETDVPASDSSDATVVIDPSDPSGQVTDGQVTDPVVTEDPAALVDDPAATVAYPAVIFDDAINVRSTGLNTDTEIGTESGLQTLVDETNLFVHVEADEETFPEGTTMVLSEVTDDTIDTVATAVEGALSAQDAAANAQQAEDASKAQTRTRGFHALDISFYDLEGNKIEPLRPVRVSITSDAIRTAVQDETTVPVVVHVEDQTAQTAVSDNAGGAAAAAETAAAETAAAGSDTALNSTVVEAAETTEAAATGRQEAAADAGQTLDTLTFEAGAFSVYAIVYTVDFHWEVDGKSYDFSIPGGGYVSLYDLVKDLGIAEDKADTEKDEIRELVDGVERIEFSNPDLVSVSKTEENTTVGAIKDGLGLECEYSADLTEKQIADINAQEVLAGDWALISLKPFDTEESMTVTMINGETWTVKVTDAQISTLFLSDNGELFEVTVTYDESANIPEGSTLKVTEFSEDDAKYEYARNSVLADKKARNEWVDLSNFNLAALDISILNPAGEEIEPEAPVQVEIRIKELPGVEDLSEIKDTLAIQHHVEVEDGVVVETVFDGNTEASFKLETNETIAASSIVVDPNSVSEEDFALSKVSESHSGKDEEPNKIDVSFKTPVFSTFTVTWEGSSTISDSVNYLFVSAANVETHNFNDNGTYQYTTYQTNNLYFMDSNQAVIPGCIFRTLSNEAATGDIYLVYNRTGNGTGDQNVTEENSTFHIRFNHQGSTYADVTVHYVDTDGNPIRRTKTQDVSYTAGSVDTRNVTGTNSENPLTGYAGTKQGYSFVGISAHRPDGSASDPHTTVHYGYMDGDNFVEFENQPSPDFDSARKAYLIYDFDGKEYAGTTYYRTSEAVNGVNVASGASTIAPRLEWDYSNRRWNLTSGSAVADGSHIYIVYEDKDVPTVGGTPKLMQVSPDDKPEVPTITKTSTVNGDGTNTLALSVTGHTVPVEVEKLADVIVIFDDSGSMSSRLDQNGENSDTTNPRRLAKAKEAVNSLADTLLQRKNSKREPLIRMALVPFSSFVQEDKVVQLTSEVDKFQAGVNALSSDGGTNWEDALEYANSMAVDSDRATFIIFVTDGDPTFRITRGETTNDNLVTLEKEEYEGDRLLRYYGVNDWYYDPYHVFGSGGTDEFNRNYDAALAAARKITAPAAKKNFYSIGISSDVTKLAGFTSAAGGKGNYSATTSQELDDAFDDIIAKINAMMGHSDVKITDGITDLTQTVQKSSLVNFAEDDFTYSKERLATAEEISDSTKVPAGAQIVNREGTKHVVWNNWDPTSEGCARAVYNTTTGAVEWNMGETFMLEDGYTYQVRFKVWPSQEAYDLLADLNNSSNPAEAYAALDENIRKQISEPAAPGGMYTLKTNSETSYTYREATKSGETVTPVGNPSEPGTFPDVDPLELTTKPLKVKKQWHNNYVDSRTLTDHITMELYGVDSDGTTSHDFKTIILSKYKLVDGHYVDSNGTALYYDHDTNKYEYEDGSEGTPVASDNPWYAENNYISYGLVTYNAATNTGAKVYETGHDFTLREIDDEAHYYELTAGVYRPMFINGTPTILEKVDAAPDGMADEIFHYSDGSHHYYRLDGKIYRDTQSDTLLIATNTHRSYMDLNKVVVDESGVAAVDDTEFEYKITFTVPDSILNYDDVEKYIWFSVYDSDARRTLAPSEYTYGGKVITPADENSIYSGPEYANYLVATSGQQVTLKIKQGWNVRFLNLPIGTNYSFEETNIPEEYRFVKAEVSGTRWIANMVDGTDQGSAQTMSSLPTNTSGANSNTSISGKIEFANARYSTTYTNRTLTKQVNILKTSQDGTTPLSGAVFSLYTKSGYEADPKLASRTDLTSDANGKIELGALACGTYYLEETSAPAGYIMLSEPVTITVSSTEVTYMQSDNSMSQSGKGISHEAATDPYTLTVTNNAGYELPSTGGPGTRLFTILGTALIAGAGLLLWMTRKSADFAK